MTSRGMTLLELLVVLAIIGIIAGIGVMTYVSWINSMKAEAAAAEFGRMVDRAKARVRATNRDVTITVTPTTGTIQLSEVVPPATSATTFGTSTLDATVTAMTCRPACTTTVNVYAPYGNLDRDVKLTLNVSTKIRDVYALGPTGLLKINRR